MMSFQTCGGSLKIAYACSIAMCLLLNLSSSAFPGPPDESEVNGARCRRPWIMVGLSTDGCSGGCKRLRSVVSDMSGNDNVVTLDFRSATFEIISDLDPEFLVLSPQGTPWCRYIGPTGIALQNFLWLIPQIAEELDIPILGICGGHQAIALAFGGKVGPIRAGTDDCMPYSRDRQSGVTKLNQNTHDPIFVGLDDKISILESHYDEVKALPPGFVLLASEPTSRNQIIRHPYKPVYGIQGHPESFLGTRPDGGAIIRNFLHIAETYNKNVRNMNKTGDIKVSLNRITKNIK
ncbi:MAG: glutamine amidotransferase-related protein [Desulfomonilaceae bacterium]